MRTPKSVQVNDEEYSLEKKKNLHCFNKRKNKKKKQELHGIVKFQDKLIQIDSNLSPADQCSTLWHELFHIIIHEFDIPIDRRGEEKLVRSLEHSFISLLEDNPKLLLWTLEQLSFNEE